MAETAPPLPARAGATGELELAVKQPSAVTSAVTLAFVDGQLAAVRLGPGTPGCLRIEMEPEDLARYLGQGDDAVHRAYLLGRMRTTGDLDVLIALAPILDSDEYDALCRHVNDMTAWPSQATG
ncbi:MAG: hypothetical protein JO148_13225 [Acidimicrobiia bacterium]|nr:hypothetical protein [Acidimicrobiia bacterium]